MKPLLALAGIALLGTAGLAGALIIGRLGGEEEVASQAQETPAPAPTQELPDGWVRFSHPGTQEAPPFSFAYPDELNVKGAALVPVTLPKGEPLGTAVLVELFSWDPGAAPSIILPADAMYLKVFVGPYAPL